MTVTASEAPAARGRGPGSILLLVLGSILGLAAIALLLAGSAAIWADQTQRDDDGYFTTSFERYETPLYALTWEDIEIGDVSETPGWAVDRLGDVRVLASSVTGRDLFIGIGPADEVRAYLAGVGHDEIEEGFDPDDLRTTAGGAPASAPGEQDFWAASTTGDGNESLSWDVDAGTWSLVVMNDDGSRAVAAEVQLGANPDFVLQLGIVLLAIAAVVGLGAGLAIFFGVRSHARAAGGGTIGAEPIAPVAEAYPVAVEARLDEPLSRWLWLVKWFLAIPHYVVLALLWLAFVVTTVVAGLSILFTGRYPRGIFDFNVGVLRWTWRVGFYALHALGTDRYPPFSLGPEPDYPATLDVPYPQRLSRGLVLVKSWLLALPHLLIVTLFGGGVVWGWSGRTVDWPGLIAILAVVAGVVLLVRGRHPRDVFELLVGLNRWVYRVIAYVALMRDEYPPFRLGR
jgi:hypothetical protein